MQQFRLAGSEQGGLWFLAGLLLACALTGFLCLASLARLETHVSGVPAHIGFSGNWDRYFAVGEPLEVAWDRAMPSGYERIYLHRGGEIIGSLPESPVTRKVREALAGSRGVAVTVVKLDPLDPAHGLRVRVSFGSGQRQVVTPVAVQALNGRHSLL